jgi:hypothetical protein
MIKIYRYKWNNSVVNFTADDEILFLIMLAVSDILAEDLAVTKVTRSSKRRTGQVSDALTRAAQDTYRMASALLALPRRIRVGVLHRYSREKSL